MGKNRKRTITRTFVYFLILLIPMLFILEEGLRLSPLHLYLTDDGSAWGKQYHPIYGWDLTPNFRGTYFDWVTNKPGEIDAKYRRTIAINSSGFRDDEETTLKKPDNTVRIFTLGDSITFGWGVESTGTFTKLLERKLNEASTGVKYQVINAAVIGFTSYQGVRLLKFKLLQYDPDIIIVAYGGTNYVLSSAPDKERIKRSSPIMTKIANIGRKLQIYRALQEIPIRFNKAHKEKMTRRVSDEDFRNDLKQIIEISKENGVGVVLMTIQSRVLSGKVSKWSISNRSISGTADEVIAEHKKINHVIRETAKTAEDKGVVLVDIADKFNTLLTKENKDLFYRPQDAMDDYHPSAEGYALIAEELFKTISANFSDQKSEALSHLDKQKPKNQS